MFDFWVKYKRILGIIFIGAQIYLGLVTLDNFITARSNSVYIESNPDLFVKDVEVDKDGTGAHKDDRTYHIATEEVFLVRSSDTITYDIKNMCVFKPYNVINMWMTTGIITVLAVLIHFCYKKKWIIITDIAVMGILVGLAWLAV